MLVKKSSLATICLLAIATVILSAFPSAATAQSSRGGPQLPSDAILNRVGLTRAWWGHAVTNSTRDKVMFLTLDEERVYVQCSNGIVSAFDSESGRRLWATQLGSSDQTTFPPAFTEEIDYRVDTKGEISRSIKIPGLVLIPNGNVLYSLEKKTGNIAWTLNLPGTPSASVATDKELLFIGMLDGSMYAFDYGAITDLTVRGLMPEWGYRALRWRYRTNKTISSPAIPGTDHVAFASKNGSMYSVTTEYRQLLFQFETDATLSAPLALYRAPKKSGELVPKEWLMLASEDYNFYCVNATNGRSAWQFSSGAVIHKAPVVIGDHVFLTPQDGGMFNLDAQTGRRVWWERSAEELIAVSPTRVYARSSSNQLLVLSRQAPVLKLGSIPLTDFTKTLVNSRNDRIYLSTAGGLILCLREKGRDFAASHIELDRQPINPEFEPEGESLSAEPPAESVPPEPMPGEAPATEAPATEASQ